MSPYLNESVHYFTVLIFAGLLVWAAIKDYREYLIPNSVSITIVVLYPAHVLVSAQPVDWIGALIAYGIVFAAGFALFSMGITGGGDVKLLAATTLCAGPDYVLHFLFVTAVAGGVLALVKLGQLRLARARQGEASQPSDGFHPTEPMKQNVAYGLAIVAGGLFVAGRLVAG